MFVATETGFPSLAIAELYDHLKQSGPVSSASLLNATKERERSLPLSK